MRIDPTEPPREFSVGLCGDMLNDCAQIRLTANEQVTFVTESLAEYDVVRKRWGYYATPSLNGRLRDCGLRPVLVRNCSGRYYILLVENGKEEEFRNYIEDEQLQICGWLDNEHTLSRIETALRGQ
jgi:hypothetical protein